MADLSARLGQKDPVVSEGLLDGKLDILTSLEKNGSIEESTGTGATREEAVVDALQRSAMQHTLRQYASSMKNPMLVVGANNWLRGKVPFFLLQQYDLHLLFYPNSTPCWVVGVAALSRVRTDEKPKFFFGVHHNVADAMEIALSRCLETCRPTDTTLGDLEQVVEPSDSSEKPKIMRLNMWWTHWIYRCPKISLKDMLHLEAYPATMDAWRDYYRDGQIPISIIGLNHELLPASLRYLVLLRMESRTQSASRNVAGIGTWATFRDGI